MSGKRWRVDALGAWELVGIGAFGVAVWGTLAWLPGPVDVPFATWIAVAVAVAVLLPALQLVGWAVRGGQRTVAETRRWVLDGRLPTDRDEDEVRDRLTRLVRDNQRSGRAAVCGVVLAVLWAVVDTTGGAQHLVFAAVWAALAVVSAVSWLRLHGPIRRMATGPVTHSV